MGLITGLFRWPLVFFLAFAFFMSGANKLTDAIHPATHSKLSSEAVKWSNVLSTLLPVSIAAPELLKIVGFTEIISAFLLLFSSFRRLSAFVLMAVMGGAAWTHLQLNEPFIVPAVLGGLSSLLFLFPGKSSSSKKKRA